jgi:hypothetical protein
MKKLSIVQRRPVLYWEACGPLDMTIVPVTLLKSEIKLIHGLLRRNFKIGEAHMYHATKEVGDVQSCPESKFNWQWLADDRDITILSTKLRSPEDMRARNPNTPAWFSMIPIEQEDGSYEGSVGGCVNTQYLYRGQVPSELQSAIVDQATRAFLLFGERSAFLTLDEYTQGSPYESATGYIVRNTTRYLRGYYWGTFVNPTQCEILGGIAQIKRNAPAYLVKSIGNSCYIQLTEDIADLSLTHVHALRDFLQPVLMQGDRWDATKANVSGEYLL